VFSEILECDAEEIPSATLKTISGFLKDNSITCQEEESSIKTLADQLAEKRAARGHKATVTKLNAMGDF
jgi:hypothetical protein